MSLLGNKGYFEVFMGSKQEAGVVYHGVSATLISLGTLLLLWPFGHVGACCSWWVYLREGRCSSQVGVKGKEFQDAADITDIVVA